MPDGINLIERGGTIPGTPGRPAFSLCGPQPSSIPVLIAVPHAGRLYPRALLDRLTDSSLGSRRLEDRHADSLAMAVACATGARVLVAHAPRAMIDLNRAPDDVDWEMFAGRPLRATRSGGNRRAMSGLGLIPRRLPGVGEIWKSRHDPDELDQRIAGVHEPYHACLGRNLAELRQRWGAALLLDFHSMPPLSDRGERSGVQVVLGDRFGASCHGRFAAAAFSQFARAGYLVAHNRPYAGGYGIRRHAASAAGIHAMQLEVDRTCYLDAGLDEPGSGFDELAGVLTGLVRALAAEAIACADFGSTHGQQGGHQEAAE